MDGESKRPEGIEGAATSKEAATSLRVEKNSWCPHASGDSGPLSVRPRHRHT